MFEISHVSINKYFTSAKQLFEECEVSHSANFGQQNFIEAFVVHPGDCVSPDACLLIAIYRSNAAGCVAVKKLEENICEMKRLYVRPQFRSMGIGLILADSIIAEARKLEYKRMRLATLASMYQAQKLYKSLGFREIPPYCFDPSELTICMELEL